MPKPSLFDNQRAEITTQIREMVLERDERHCRYCGSDKEPFEIDHVYPVSKGGESSLENYVTACARCNRHKHNKVGVWPKPVGYFKRFYVVSPNDLRVLLFGIIVCAVIFLVLLPQNTAYFWGFQAIYFGVWATIIGIKREKNHEN